MNTFCNWFGSICNGITSLLNITPSPWNNEERSEVDVARPLSSASLNQVVHYGQIITSGDYKQFDYGNDKNNQAHYKSDTPPAIPLENIAKVPIAMFMGQYDDLSVATDTKRTYNKVKTSFYYKIYPDMDHMSFMLGKNMSYMDDVIRIVGDHNKLENQEPKVNKACGHNEAVNDMGPNKCVEDSECNGFRTCSSSGWCQGESFCHE